MSQTPSCLAGLKTVFVEAMSMITLTSPQVAESILVGVVAIGARIPVVATIVKLLVDLWNAVSRVKANTQKINQLACWCAQICVMIENARRDEVLNQDLEDISLTLLNTMFIVQGFITDISDRGRLYQFLNRNDIQAQLDDHHESVIGGLLLSIARSGKKSLEHLNNLRSSGQHTRTS